MLDERLVDYTVNMVAIEWKYDNHSINSIASKRILIGANTDEEEKKYWSYMANSPLGIVAYNLFCEFLKEHMDDSITGQVLKEIKYPMLFNFGYIKRRFKPSDLFKSIRQKKCTRLDYYKIHLLTGEIARNIAHRFLLENSFYGIISDKNSLVDNQPKSISSND